jgi:hypothetical protein
MILDGIVEAFCSLEAIFFSPNRVFLLLLSQIPFTKVFPLVWVSFWAPSVTLEACHLSGWSALSDVPIRGRLQLSKLICICQGVGRGKECRLPDQGLGLE